MGTSPAEFGGLLPEAEQGCAMLRGCRSELVTPGAAGQSFSCSSVGEIHCPGGPEEYEWTVPLVLAH